MGRGNCCCNLPYVAAISAAVTVAGLAVWSRYFHLAHGKAVDTLAVVGVSSPLLPKVNKNATVFLIFTCVDLALLVLLALWRTSLLCRRNRSESGSSGTFKFLGALAALATFVVVVWAAANLTLMGAAGATMGVGHFAAKTAGTELSKFGVAADLSAQAAKVIDAYDSMKTTDLIPDAFMLPVESAVDALRPYVTNGTDSCGPFCLNLRSFKFVEVKTQCICDPKLLLSAADRALEGAKASVGALAGGFILLVGMLWLLMNISGQVGGACSDSWHAAALKEEESKPVQFHSA